MKTTLTISAFLILCCAAFGQTHTEMDLESNQTATGVKTFSGGAISSSLNVSGVSTLSGGVSTPKINNMFWVDGTTFTTIAACYAAISAGGTCILPPGYTETLSANLILNKKNTTIQAMGLCTITLNSFNVQISQGTDDVSIISPFTHSSDQGGNSQGCTLNGYTGSGAAIDVGSSAGFTYNTLIRGLQVNLSSAAANAICYRLTNEVQGAMDDDSCIQGAVSGQKGFSTVGTGALFAGLIRILSPECSAALGATNNICIQFGAISNDNMILGGHANVLGSGANGSVCIDVSGATSGNNSVLGFDCDTGVTAVTIESTVNAALKGFVNVDSGVTNIANFGAGSFGNSITTTANLPFTDSGTVGTNSVINPARWSWRTDKWQMFQSASTVLWQDVPDGTARIVFAQGAGGRSDLNGASGGGTVNLAWDSGTGGVLFGNGASVQVASVDSTGKGTFNGGIVNTVIGATTPAAGSFTTLNSGTFQRTGTSTNRVSVGSDFTTANNTSLQAITGLIWTFPSTPAANYSFHCSLSYSQATANAAVAFGIQASNNNPTNIFANGTQQITVGAPATFTTGTLATLATTTATNIVSGTPGATATNYTATLDGTLEFGASVNTVSIMTSTATGADAVTVKRGSYCNLF